MFQLRLHPLVSRALYFPSREIHLARDTLLQGVVTLSADDFMDFLLGYFVEFGMMMLMRIYFDPGLEDVIGWVGDTTNALISMAKRKLPKWLIGSAAETAAEEDEEKKEDEKEDEGGGSADTVEPLLGSFGSYSCDMVSMFMTPFVTVLLMFYSKETHLPGLYGIKDKDMRYYIYFQILIIPFQIVGWESGRATNEYALFSSSSSSSSSSPPPPSSTS